MAGRSCGSNGSRRTTPWSAPLRWSTISSPTSSTRPRSGSSTCAAANHVASTTAAMRSVSTRRSRPTSGSCRGRPGARPTCRGTARSASTAICGPTRSASGQCSDAAVQQPRFTPHGEPVHVHDGSGWLNIHVGDRPVVSEPVEHAGPTWGMGNRSFAFDDTGERLAFTRNERGHGALCVIDLGTGVVEQIGRGVHGHPTWVGDSPRRAAHRRPDTDPDRAVRPLHRHANNRGTVAARRLAAPTTCRSPS